MGSFPRVDDGSTANQLATIIKPEPVEHHLDNQEAQANDDEVERGGEESSLVSLTKSHLPIQRPIPLFSSHHLPIYIREKLRAAASSMEHHQTMVETGMMPTSTPQHLAAANSMEHHPHHHHPQSLLPYHHPSLGPLGLQHPALPSRCSYQS